MLQHGWVESRALAGVMEEWGGVVFAGPVAWTEKKTETEPNATDSNRTIGCGCLVWELVRLPVALLFKYSKTDKRPVATDCNRSFNCIYSMYNIYSKKN